MTPRERLLAFLSNDPVDRVPIWLLFPYHPTSYYADVRALPQYREIYTASLERAVYLNRRNFEVPLFTPEVATSREEVTEGHDRISRTIYEYRDLRLTEEFRQCPNGPRQKLMLNSDEDLAAFMQFPLEYDEDRLAAALDPQIARWREEADEFPLDLGAMMNNLSEPVGQIYHRANLEEYAVWSLTAAEQIAAILDALMGQSRFLYRYLLERNIGEVVFMVGSELASPPLVSRATFQRWVVPHARELIALVHSYGKKVIQHYHGQIREILPDFLTMAPDALHTIEAPPVGNCTLADAFAVFGDRIGLIGNIQYDEFHRLTPDEMDAAVSACLEECRGQRFMLSPTAGPYETEVPPRLRENYLRFMEAGWRYGG